MYLAPVVHQLLPPNTKLKEILRTNFIHMFYNNITSTKVAHFFQDLLHHFRTLKQLVLLSLIHMFTTLLLMI